MEAYCLLVSLNYDKMILLAQYHLLISYVVASCSYWYSLVPSPELKCDPLGTGTSLACGVYVPRDPPTTVKWYKSEFPQKDTRIIAISDNTDGYELRSLLATTPVPSGNFSGLFYDQYILVIINFTASDTGYYWCQIETNSTEDSLTFQPSQYGYRAPNPGQSECTSGLVWLPQLPMVNYWDGATLLIMYVYSAVC